MADDSDEQIRKISEDFKREISKKIITKIPRNFWKEISQLTTPITRH